MDAFRLSLLSGLLLVSSAGLVRAECDTKVFVVDGAIHTAGADGKGLTAVDRLDGLVANQLSVSPTTILVDPKVTYEGWSGVKPKIDTIATSIEGDSPLVITHFSAFSSDPVSTDQDAMTYFLNQMQENNASVVLYSRSAAYDPSMFKTDMLNAVDDADYWKQHLVIVGNERSVPRWSAKDDLGTAALTDALSNFATNCGFATQ